MIYTTLNKIRAHHPCADGWGKLLGHIGKTQSDDEPLALVTILESNGLDDCLWCLRSVPEHDRVWRLYAVWCARRVQHLMTDQRIYAALDVAERYANGDATEAELDAAWAAARAAGAAAGAAAEDAALAAGAAAGAAARDAARAAWAAALDAEAAAEDAARAAGAAGAAARAAGAAARSSQEIKLREILAENGQ